MGYSLLNVLLYPDASLKEEAERKPWRIFEMLLRGTWKV